MNLQEQAEANRQNELLKERRRLIEQGKLQSCQPMSPNDTPPGVPAHSADRCPSCDRVMQYFPARKAYLCLECQ